MSQLGVDALEASVRHLDLEEGVLRSDESVLQVVQSCHDILLDLGLQLQLVIQYRHCNVLDKLTSASIR